MENNVVETVEKVAPVVSEVVETAQNQAIAPIAVPQITIPVKETKKIIDNFSLKDIGVASGLFAGGVGAAVLVPWLFKKAKKAVEDVKIILSYGKEHSVNQNQAPAPAPAPVQQNQAPQPEAQPTNVNPAPQA